jgi:signal transduction histidine kinase
MVIAASRPVLRAVSSLVDLLSRLSPLSTAVTRVWLGLAAMPLAGSLITEPAAMTVAALMLRGSVFRRGPPESLKYLALGVLFVNVSIGGTLTSYAAPPVLMVAATWQWDSAFMFATFGWKALLAVLLNATLATWFLRRHIAGADTAGGMNEPVPGAVQLIHREVIANVAHDLRTPLTALHGHLEALAHREPPLEGEDRQRHLATALAQSDKVRRLSQQLFELASLQASGHVLQLERFRLDELVTDAVQKVELSAPQGSVMLEGSPPGRIELDGDLQLIERALTNLIDNAVRHAPGPEPVRVRLQRDEARASVLIEDRGPRASRRAVGTARCRPPRARPALRRPGGGFGGLGLAIAQRIAWLHGGTLADRSHASGRDTAVPGASAGIAPERSA